jgi:hypothetical protein
MGFSGRETRWPFFHSYQFDLGGGGCIYLIPIDIHIIEIIIIITGNKKQYDVKERGTRHSLHFASSSLLSIRSFIHSFAR